MFIAKDTKRSVEISSGINGEIVAITLFFGTTRKELQVKQVGGVWCLPSFYWMLFTDYAFPVRVYSDKPYENIKIVVDNYIKNEGWRNEDI